MVAGIVTDMEVAPRLQPLLFRSPRHRRPFSRDLSKVCKWCASKATTKESDESDSSSSTVLKDSSQEHGRSFKVWNKILNDFHMR